MRRSDRVGKNDGSDGAGRPADEARAFQKDQYQGFVDFVNGQRISGWVVCLNRAQSTPVRVGVLVRGKVVSSTTADSPRNDLDKTFCKDGRAGFSFSRDGWDANVNDLEVEISVLGENGTPIFPVPWIGHPEYRSAGVFPKPLTLYPDLFQLQQQTPLFILGAARSGTSALQAAIVRSSDYLGFDEGHVLPLIRNLRSAVFQFYMANEKRLQEPTALAAIAEEYWQGALMNLSRRMFYHLFGDRKWVDKTPSPAMIDEVPFLSSCWPKAKFIFAKRRGIEVIESRRRKFPKLPFRASCSEWKTCMQTWHAVRHMLDGRFIEVDQLETARSPDAVAHRLAQFLALPAEQTHRLESALRELHPEKTQSANDTTLSVEGLDWSDADKQFFVEECGAIMKECGYSFDKSYYRN
jgi:hypothetical protein